MTSTDGTTPDPFCQFEMPAHDVTAVTAAVTPTVKDSYMPEWNFDVSPGGMAVKASALTGGSMTWRLWVGDDDGAGMGQEICEIDQPLSEAALDTGQLVVANVASCLSLTVKFVCAD
jgi:hypothetical protein